MEKHDQAMESESSADEQPDDTLLPPDELFTQLYCQLHECRCGRITFLQLLERWKKILRIPPSTKA